MGLYLNNLNNKNKKFKPLRENKKSTKIAIKKNLFSIYTENDVISTSSSYMNKQPDIEKDSPISNHQYSNKEDYHFRDSIFSLIANSPSNPNIPEEQLPKPKKKKKKGRRL